MSAAYEFVHLGCVSLDLNEIMTRDHQQLLQLEAGD
jgi:hypothetical protein